MAQTLEYNGSIHQVSAVTVPAFDEDMDIIQKLDDEPNDVGGLTADQLKAEFDAAGKKTKEYINNELIPAILASALTEETRANAEAERVANEQERVSNEEARISGETGRTTAEANRVIAENNRLSAEQTRVTAESARVAAEQARVDSTNGIVAQATTQTNNAKNSADAAKSFATAAASSASFASNSASEAASSASSAATSSSSASSSAVAAKAAQAAAEKARDEAQNVAGGVSSQINAHNTNTSAHSDIRTAVSNAASAASMAQTTANSKVAKTDVVQDVGTSTNKVMSQKAVTDAIAAEHDAAPNYWLPALQSGVEEINKALCAAGANKSAFLFYTDAHWTYSAKKSPALLKYLYRHTGITKTFFGGDIVNNEADDYDTMAYLWEWRRRVKDLPNHHSVPGNHDDGNTTNHLFDKNYVYGYLLAAEETPSIVRGDGLYYYIDNPAEKTRYLYLDTACFGVDSKQESFVKDALLSTPDEWHIVAVAHIWVNTDYTVSPPVPSGINADAAKLLTMFDAYNSRTGDYAKCKGWVEFCIGGHTHWDYDTTSSMGIPVVLMETDSRDVRSGLGFTAGTTTEASVSGVIADYGAKKIKVVRVGRGANREVEMTWYEVPYVNQIPISTDAIGAIYNGTGYKDGIRLGSDGADRTGAATDATGFIPCTPADTLYFKNCQIAVLGGSSTTYQAIGCYDSAKTFIKTRFVDLSSEMTDKDYAVDASGYLTRYNCSDLWSDTAFVRITGNYIGADSIITVNESIE